MIDLSLTAEKMLEELKVPQDVQPLNLMLPSDIRLVTEPVVQLALKFHHRDEVFRELRKKFKKRFKGEISLGRLDQGLLNPLKRAIGNSFKHGNLESMEKLLKIEATVTDRGALISLTDQGNGFNAEQVYRNFREGQNYAKYKGKGFLTYDSSQSRISFINGGRTFILLFLISE